MVPDASAGGVRRKVTGGATPQTFVMAGCSGMAEVADTVLLITGIGGDLDSRLRGRRL